MRRKALRAVGSLALTVGLLAGGWQPASGQTLEDSMLSALRANPRLAAERERVDVTKQNLAVAWSDALPQVSFSADSTKVDRKSPSFQFAHRGSTQKYREWTTTTNASQLLFSSGRVISNVRQARAQISGSFARFDDAQQQLLVDVTRSYADLIRARATLQAQKESVAIIIEQRKFVVANRRAGFLTVTDLAQADARLALAKSELSRAQAQIAAAEESFARTVGFRAGDLVQPGSPTNLPATLDDAVSYAEKIRPAMRAARANVKAASSAVGAVAAEGRPRVTLNASTLEAHDYEASPGSNTVEQIYSVRVTVPIFSGGSVRARTQAQRAQLRAARYDETAVRDEIRQDVISFWANLEASRESVTATQEQVEAAELALKGIRREQENGLRSTIDVLNQERDLLQARLQFARAVRDFTLAERQLLFAIGALSPDTGAPGGVFYPDAKPAPAVTTDPSGYEAPFAPPPLQRRQPSGPPEPVQPPAPAVDPIGLEMVPATNAPALLPISTMAPKREFWRHLAPWD